MGAINKLRRSWAIAIVMVVAVIFITQPAFGRDTSPLSSIEQSAVVAATGLRAGVNFDLSASMFDSVERQALLLVERRPAPKGDSRRLANVFVYHYDDDILSHLVVDTADNTLVHSLTMSKVQLPLIDDERQLAVNILFSHPASRALLEDEFKRVTGRSLGELTQINYKASTFVAEGEGDTRTRNCGVRRCARILMYTADNVVLDLAPVVDLSQESVLKVVASGRETR